jgi:hypothetical protein
MSFTPDFEQQNQLAESMQISRAMMSARERAAELLIDGGFVAVVITLLILRPPEAFHPWRALLCVLLVSIATLVEFDLPWGFTVATQLAYVPLLFAVPVALAPAAVVVALMLAFVPRVIRGELTPARLIKRIGDAWFAIGPALVFVIAHTSPRHAGPALLVAAFAAQFAVDFIASSVRFSISHRFGWR